jgi:hypothetical protein
MPLISLLARMVVGNSDDYRWICVRCRASRVCEYKQAQHDFASGIKQTQFQSVDYHSGYDEACKDADMTL